MLIEIPSNTHERGLRRRWFRSDDLDLIVWLESERRVVAFHLCYDKATQEHAIVWSETEGYTHFRVDDGESDPRKNQTPVLVADGAFQEERVTAKFVVEAVGLEPALRDFVADRLRAAPVQRR